MQFDQYQQIPKQSSRKKSSSESGASDRRTISFDKPVYNQDIERKKASWQGEVRA